MWGCSPKEQSSLRISALSSLKALSSRSFPRFPPKIRQVDYKCDKFNSNVFEEAFPGTATQNILNTCHKSFLPAPTERPSARSYQCPDWFHWQGTAVWGEGHKVQGDPVGGRSHTVQHLHWPQRQAGEGNQHRHPPWHLQLHQGDPWNGADYKQWIIVVEVVSYVM